LIRLDLIFDSIAIWSKSSPFIFTSKNNIIDCWIKTHESILIQKNLGDDQNYIPYLFNFKIYTLNIIYEY